MYSSFFAILSFFFLLLAYYTASSTAAEADCLRKTGSPVTSSSAPTRISVGVVCSKTENRNCTIRSGGFVEIQRTTNLTTTSHNAEEIVDTFGKAYNVTFNSVTYVDVSRAEFVVEPGRNGYIGYTYSQRCYTGVIEKDCFDDIPIGTPVTTCQPYMQRNDTVGLWSLPSKKEFFDTDEATARKMTTNPALRVSPDLSGAAHLLSHGGWPSSLLMVIMVMTVVRIGDYFIAF